MREITYVLIILLVGAPGLHLLRNPATRSFRTVVTVVTSGLVAVGLGSSDVGPSIGSILGHEQAGIAARAILTCVPVLIPLLVANRWSKVVASLPPADWDTHWAIWDLRQAMRRSRGSESEFGAYARQARARLADMQLPADVWKPVREALLQQIEVTERILAGEAVDREAARAIRSRSDSTWQAAFNARRRFFR